MGAPLSQVPDACSLAFRISGAKKAPGHSFDSKFGINVEYGEVPSPDSSCQLVSSMQGEWSELSSGLMARKQDLIMVINVSLNCNEFKLCRGRAGGTKILLTVSMFNILEEQELCYCIVKVKQT